MRIDAAQIATAQCRAVTVEEFENLDGDLATVFDPIAKLRSGKPPVFCAARDVAYDPDHLRRDPARKEMVMRDLIGGAHARDPLKHSPNLGLRDAGRRYEIAHSRRPESCLAHELRLDQPPERLVLLGQSRLVTGQTRPGALEAEVSFPRARLHHLAERRCGKFWGDRETQPFDSHAGKVGVFGVEGREPPVDLAP